MKKDEDDDGVSKDEKIFPENSKPEDKNENRDVHGIS